MINKAIKDFRSALAKERSHFSDELDPGTDADRHVIGQTKAAAERLQSIAATVHGREVLEHGYVSCEPVGFETEDGHIVVTLPAWICGAIGTDEYPLTFAIHKSAIVKLADSQSK